VVRVRDLISSNLGIIYFSTSQLAYFLSAIVVGAFGLSIYTLVSRGVLEKEAKQRTICIIPQPLNYGAPASNYAPSDAPSQQSYKSKSAKL
jgi:hypothetical protein